MASPYRELFSIPGTRGFVAAGLLGRMSMSMTGLGIVLMVSAVSGSYAIAGAVSATCSLAVAASAPVIGRFSDRLGQARVLPPLVSASTASLTALILCGALHAPSWAFFPAALALGLSSPSIGAMVRARWSHLLQGTSLKHAAFSFESVADEVTFVTGPMIVTFLSTGLTPWSGLLATAVFVFTGGMLFAAQRRTQPPPRAAVQGEGRPVILIPAIAVIAGVFFCLGSLFGAIDVTTVAFTQEHGDKDLAGVMLGCYALGSAIGGLWYGARHWNAPLESRFRTTLGVMLAGLVPVVLVARLSGSYVLPVMIVLTFLAGLAISPTLISGFGLVEQIAPAHRITEGLTWITTAIGIGVALGSTVAGRLVDSFGAADAYLYPISIGIVGLVVGVTGASQFHKSDKHEFPS